MRAGTIGTAAAAGLLALSVAALAQQSGPKAVSAAARSAPAARPVITLDGTVRVPAFALPPSSFMSKESADQLRRRAAAAPMTLDPASGGIVRMRAGMETLLAPLVALMRGRHPTDEADGVIAGVRVRTYTPRGKPGRADRVLINLHGGAFMLCATACAALESIPLAAVGGYKVISVDYRQGPEHRFPAATEDVAAVYRELLKTYRPSRIGIYGCSAGGTLAAQVAAWLPRRGLARPGAIGVFGAGAVSDGQGDSAYLAAHIDGTSPPPVADGSPAAARLPYFAGADLSDPMVSPARHLDALTGFPPTLVITGTRAADLSPAVYTHSRLVKAGVDADLIVGEGQGHCYIYNAGLPEAQDAYRTIARFFDKHLR